MVTQLKQVLMIQKLTRIIQWLPMIGLLILEYLSSYYPLVMRHLYTRKLVHLGIITTSLKLVICFLVVGFTLFQITKYKKWKTLSFVTLLTLLFIWLPYTNEFFTYTYGIGVCLYIYLIESILNIRKHAV